jgi:hypothetical protein
VARRHAHLSEEKRRNEVEALGRPGWRDDLRHRLALARSADPLSYARVVTYAYFVGIPAGVLRPDDRVVREIEDALRMAERSVMTTGRGTSRGQNVGKSAPGLPRRDRQTVCQSRWPLAWIRALSSRDQKSQSSSSVLTALPITYDDPDPEKKSWFSSALGDNADRIAGFTSVSSRGNSAS